jgi:glycosyltransferase involved in cell wall biosynthesis
MAAFDKLRPNGRMGDHSSQECRSVKLLLTADAVGGVWQYATDLARGLGALGVETVLALLGPPPEPAQLKAAGRIPGLTLVDTGLPLDWLAPSPQAVAEAGEAIAALATRHKADLVQLNAPALAAEARFEQPVLAVSHSCLVTWWAAVKGVDIDPDFRWRAELHGEGLRRSRAVITPTAAFAEATQAAYRLPQRPRAIHNGRSPLPLPKVAPHDFAFTAGRLWDEGKNVATLDRAAARLAVPLYAIGPTTGPNGAAVSLSHAHVLGSRSEKEIGRWLAARPVFVSAARYEPFGLAVLEAAAAGCPLVLSDIPTFRELWDGAATFVDPDDANGFAAAVDRIVGDDAARLALGNAARERAALYTPRAMAAAMADLYRALAPKAATPAAQVAA